MQRKENKNGTIDYSVFLLMSFFLLFSLLIFVRLLEEATIRSNSDRGDSVHLKIHHILSCVTWPIKYSIPSPLQVGPTCHMHFADEFQTRFAKEYINFVENQ